MKLLKDIELSNKYDKLE